MANIGGFKRSSFHNVTGTFYKQKLITNCKKKGEWQSLVLYVKEPVSRPPVDEMSWNFACREQMGLRFQGKKVVS